jgi:hypothetical protein
LVLDFQNGDAMKTGFKYPHADILFLQYVFTQAENFKENDYLKQIFVEKHHFHATPAPIAITK